MNQRFFLTALGVGAFVVASPLIGCGDFSGNDEPVDSTGGTGGDAAGSGGDAAGSGGDAAGSGGTVEQPEPSCENVVPCGGDVTGNWFAVDSCLSTSGVLDVTALGIGCSEGTVEGTLEVSGNLRFDASVGGEPPIATDDTLTTTQQAALLDIGIGPECLDVSGTMIQCDGVTIPLASAGFADPTTCVVAADGGGGCDCTATVYQESVPGFVTKDTSDLALYTAEGNLLSLQGNVTVDYDYCVEGEYMHVTPKTAGAVGTMKGTILFRKQP